MENSNEVNRLEALHRYELLDTPPDGAFDAITALASKLFNMPIAIISMVDHDRIWFKSKYGLEGVEEIDRSPGLCASAILSDDVYIVENAIEDPRTLTNPLVRGKFGLRFYAAAPLHTREGYNLGTICVIDKSQRFLNTSQLAMLEDLAAIVIQQMELRLDAMNRHREDEERIRSLRDENARLHRMLKKEVEGGPSRDKSEKRRHR